MALPRMENGLTLRPALITADQNNYALHPAYDHFLITVDLPNINITGFAGHWPGRKVIITNESSDAFTIDNESVSSTAANRCRFSGGNLSVAQYETVVLEYVEGDQRWYLNR